jgi:hypothetical protein
MHELGLDLDEKRAARMSADERAMLIAQLQRARAPLPVDEPPTAAQAERAAAPAPPPSPEPPAPTSVPATVESAGVAAATPAPAQAARGAVPYEATPEGKRDEWDAAAAEGRLRAWAGVDVADPPETAWEKYARGFAWVDSATANTFGAYKEPHHDVEDGELVLSRAGLAAAAGRVDALDVGDGGKDKVRAHLEEHYHALDLKAPWEPDAVEKAVAAASIIPPPPMSIVPVPPPVDPATAPDMGPLPTAPPEDVELQTDLSTLLAGRDKRESHGLLDNFIERIRKLFRRGQANAAVEVTPPALPPPTAEVLPPPVIEHRSLPVVEAPSPSPPPAAPIVRAARRALPIVVAPVKRKEVPVTQPAPPPKASPPWSRTAPRTWPASSAT